MQSVSDLKKLRDAINGRVTYLRQVAQLVSAPLGSEDRRAISYVAIELDNVIITGLRQYTKSSLLGSRTADGQRITASVKPNSTEEAAALIYASLNPAGYDRNGRPASIKERDEITFRDPKRAEKVMTDYAASNLPNLTVALSLNAQVFGELKTLRHFFAHRAQNTFEAVQKFAIDRAIIKFETPEHLVLRGRPGTGVKFLDGWLAEVENFFELAL